jgi:ADP-ribose pyrophosphatase
MTATNKDQHLIEKEQTDERVYDGKLVKLHVQTVQLPNGEISKREIVKHPGAVAVVALSADEKVYMIRQFRKPADRVLLEIPAGTLKHNEDPKLAAIRELQEEIGFRPDKIERIGGIWVAPGYTTEYIHLYLARDLVKDPLNLDSDEFVETVVFSLPDAMEKALNGEIEDAKTITGLLLTARILGK